MKKSIILLTLVMALLLACALIPSSTAGTTYKVGATAICDVNSNVTLSSGVTAGADVSRNLTLPCPLSELNSSASFIQIQSGDVGNLTFNLTVNGVATNTTTAILNNTMENVTFPILQTNGVSNASAYFNVAVEIADNNSGTIIVFLNATSINFTTATISTAQTRNTKVEVFWDKSDSKYTVTDNVSTNNTCDFNVTAVNLTINYTCAGYYGEPGLSRDALTYALGALNVNITGYSEFTYMKRGPYVLRASVDTTETQYVATVRVKAFEAWTGRIIDFTFFVDERSSIFPSFDYDGVEVEWDNRDVKSGDIKTDEDDYEVTVQDQNLDTGATVLYFTWTPVSVVSVVTGVGEGLIPGLSAEEVFMGLDWSMLILVFSAIAIIIIGVVVVWWKIKK